MTFNRDNLYNDFPFLPPKKDIETKAVLKQTITASRCFGGAGEKGTHDPQTLVKLYKTTKLTAHDHTKFYPHAQNRPQRSYFREALTRALYGG